jgi:hypothetical protein
MSALLTGFLTPLLTPLLTALLTPLLTALLTGFLTPLCLIPSMTYGDSARHRGGSTLLPLLGGISQGVIAGKLSFFIGS